jgi:tRNA modification GTPase
VADYIEAATATAARAAVRSLSGAFSGEVHALVDGVTKLRMLTEATLDFPDEDIDFLRAADAAGQLQALRAVLATLLARATTGVRLARGLALVLVGRPNVGKSSLLNRLVREDAAIVTPLPGTTRDTVERPVEIAGIPLTIVDTAGLRDTHDEVERLGIERTWAAIRRADLALVLVDAREAADALHADDAAVLASLPADLPRLVVHNKADLIQAQPRVERRDERTHVWLSALTGAGVELLEDEVLAIVGVASVPEDAFIARERHLAALREAAACLDEADAQLAAPRPALELYAESLREAQDALATITGEFTADDLLGVIFSRFCIGK